MPHSVLIVGAGPSGLTIGAELARHGVTCRIIDKALAPSVKSKAIVVQARTLEIFSLMQLADEFVAAGHPIHAVNIYSNGKRIIHLGFDELDSAYPYLLTLAQPETERILGDRLRQLGVAVERGVELLSMSQDAEKATVELRHADGHTERTRIDWIVGCDGAHSTVRRALDIPFEGHTFEQQFVLADVHVDSSLSDDEAHIFSQHGDICAIFPLSGGRYRIIADNPPASLAAHEPTLDECQAMVTARVQVPAELSDPEWITNFRINSRLVRQLRSRRVFLAGDAAHIHSPAGGQGMNTGIGDVINLAWKLAAVLGGRAPDSLLDSYEAERIGFARRLVATTDRAFSIATADGALADILRTRIAPMVLSNVVRIEVAREFLFRMVSQITLNYRDGPLSAGKAGRVHGGDRLPWAPVEGEDNFASLAAMVWQVHVYGAASEALVEWCGNSGLPLHVFAWRPEHETAGLTQNALYLLRPDSYVALVDPSGSPDALEQYRAARSIEFAAASPP